MAEKKKRRKAIKAIWICLAILLAVILAGFLIATHNWNDPVLSFEKRYENLQISNPYITPVGETMVSAHRSGGGIFPENTLMAFEGCIDSETFRTDIFEFDLHITRDGALILLHDDTLDRTTDSEEVFGVKNARPEDYTLAELRRLNFGEGFTDVAGNTPYRGLRGENVPDALRAATLGEVLDLLEANGGFRYIIEIKNRKALGFRAADRIYEELKTRGLLDRAIVGTFNGEVTRYLDETYPDMLRSASIREVIGFYLDSTFQLKKAYTDYKFAALQIPANQFLIKLGTSRLVNYAHSMNIAVQYWTINEGADILYLRGIGADCIMSDLPDLAYSLIHEAE